MNTATDRTIEHVKTVHEDRWITARTVNVRLNNGNTLENFLLIEPKSKGFVSVCARLADGRFLFAHQCKPVSGMSIESVAGACPKEGAEVETVLKEMLAETRGYSPGRLLRVNKFGFYTQTDRIDNRCHLFLAFDCVPTSERETQDEAQGVDALILTPQEVRLKIENGEIKDMPTLAGIFAHFVYEAGKF